MPTKHDPVRLLVFALREGDTRLTELLVDAFRSDRNLAERASHAISKLERFGFSSTRGRQAVAAAVIRRVGPARGHS